MAERHAGLVPVAALARRGERFRCAPYGAVLSAAACLARQAARAAQDAAGRKRYALCRGCAAGAVVQARVGHLPPEPPAAPAPAADPPPAPSRPSPRASDPPAWAPLLAGAASGEDPVPPEALARVK